MTSECTQEEAEVRAGLIEVESYDVSIDLTDPEEVRSRSEIRFSCREAGSSSFAEISAPTIARAVLNGESLQPGSPADGRLRLDSLAPHNLLAVEAVLPYTRVGRGASRFTDPLDGNDYVLVWSYPTSAPTVFCCFDQPDLRADFNLTVSARQVGSASRTAALPSVRRASAASGATRPCRR